jgi:hypothetical protein
MNRRISTVISMTLIAGFVFAFMASPAVAGGQLLPIAYC